MHGSFRCAVNAHRNELLLMKTTIEETVFTPSRLLACELAKAGAERSDSEQGQAEHRNSGAAVRNGDGVRREGETGLRRIIPVCRGGLKDAIGIRDKTAASYVEKTG